MIANARSGSVVTLLADSGDRYADTYFCDEWLTAQGLGSLRRQPRRSSEFENGPGRWPWTPVGSAA